MLKPGPSGQPSRPARASDDGSSPPAEELLARAAEAARSMLAVVELGEDSFRLVACTAAFQDFFELIEAPSEGSSLDLETGAISPNFVALWRESCRDARRTQDVDRCQFLDDRTSPPRRLSLIVAPLDSKQGAAHEDRYSLRMHRISEPLSTPLSPTRAGTAEGAQAAKAAHFHHLIDTLPALIWTSNAEGERDYFNRSWLAFTGRRMREDMGHGWMANIHQEDLDRYQETFRDACAGRNRFRVEYRMAADDGTFHWLIDEGVPRFRSDGEFLGYVATCTDISERKRAEHRLTSSERWHRELIEGTDNLILQIDRQGRLVFANPVSRQILGSEPEECVGFPFLHFVHTEERERTEEHLDSWWRGEPISLHLENRVVSRGGEIFDLLWTFSAQRQGEQPVTLSCFGQNITERKRSERIHKIQSQVLESMIEGVTLANQGGFVLYTNSALDRMFGYRPGELIGQHLSVLGGRPEGLSEPDFFEHLNQKGRYIGDFVHRRKGGDDFHTVARIQSLDIEGAVHWVSVIEDVNDRRLAELQRERLDARVRQAQKLESLGALAGGIAHDFNNLLMVILGNASLVLQDLDPESDAHNDLEQIETAAVRASDLTKQMLAYSGRGQFLVEPVDLSAMVEEIDHLLDSSTGQDVMLNFHLDPKLRKVEADVTQLRQAVVSLVSNASEALEERGGLIFVRTGCRFFESEHLKDTFLDDDLPRGYYAFIEVNDTGQGMNEEVLGKIFDPFFTTKFTGRGLGLAAVLGIVRGHKGGIKVQSRPGEGSTFTILLPCMETDDEPGDFYDPSYAVAVPEGTVLLVDDDHNVRQMARRMLEKIGLKVLDAESGEQALELYNQRADDISLVILDMTMPKMDGRETFRRLRERDPDVRVILSSGYSENIAAERFEDQSLAGFLQKPYRQVELIHCLRGVMS